jgi:hypothetical protein
MLLWSARGHVYPAHVARMLVLMRSDDTEVMVGHSTPPQPYRHPFWRSVACPATDPVFGTGKDFAARRVLLAKQESHDLTSSAEV